MQEQLLISSRQIGLKSSIHLQQNNTLEKELLFSLHGHNQQNSISQIQISTRTWTGHKEPSDAKTHVDQSLCRYTCTCFAAETEKYSKYSLQGRFLLNIGCLPQPRAEFPLYAKQAWPELCRAVTATNH